MKTAQRIAMDLPGQDALVIYKNRPARVKKIKGGRIELELPGGRSQKVRPKDIVLLHEGPVRNLEAVAETGPADLSEVWEILQNEPPLSPAELAELLFGSATPERVFAVWRAVAEGFLFKFEDGQLVARSQEEIEAERAKRKAREAKLRAWEAFLERAREGRIIPNRDHDHLQDVVRLAQQRSERSRVLEALGIKQTPEEAHRLLLRWGVWSPRDNPYPERCGVPKPLPDEPLPELPEEPRRDLTHLRAFAIDDEGSNDPDDAVGFDPETETLWIHVADPAALIQPDSEIDRKARERGATLYLPDQTLPMLPDAVRRLFGLGLQERSPALSIGVKLSPQGEICEVEIVPSWIRARRLSYEASEPLWEREPTLKALAERLERFRRRRFARGAREVTLPEVKIQVDPEGKIHFLPLPPIRSRRLLQEAMLLAGEAVARFALRNQIPMPFTTQPPPRELENVPEGLAGQYALRKTFMPTQYRSAPAPHGGLGLDVYVQATSPMRRYLDLVVHQQLRAFLQRKPLIEGQALLERVAAGEVGRTTIRQAERLSKQHWTLVYLLEAGSWQGRAIVVEYQRPFATVILPELGFETRIYSRQPLPLNGEVELRLKEVDLPTRRAFFEIVSADSPTIGPEGESGAGKMSSTDTA